MMAHEDCVSQAEDAYDRWKDSQYDWCSKRSTHTT
jgi:hypothetical protein